jgi:hypothetical protein
VFSSVDLRRARSDARLRAQVARPLLVVLAALALLGSGSWDGAPRADAAPLVVAGPSSSVPAGADRLPPRALELRAALLAAVPAPLSPLDPAPPERVGVEVSFSAGAGPAQAPVVPASASAPGEGSRAPPGSAGTSAPLPIPV